METVIKECGKERAHDGHRDSEGLRDWQRSNWLQWEPDPCSEQTVTKAIPYVLMAE